MGEEEEPRRRSRSRSPPRRTAPKSGRGFRWKEKRPNDNDGDRRDGDRRDSDRRRDYRNRSPPRHRNYDRDNDRPRNGRYRNDRDRDSHRPSRDDRTGRRDRGEKDGGDNSAKKEKKAPPAPVAAPGQEMIVVNINDRLGTKSAIPCLPSDTIRELKIMVAARIGREPGQIMLKRQGERPFKDQLSLEDYGISNGVQLDLEIDTGD